jgi:two-component system, NtrC family, nitrogen regulation response regulator GlnG
MKERDHIWVIDDDRSIRWVLERALKLADMEVASFESANAAMAALQQSRPDAMITDIRMPGMDGFGLLKHIHENFPKLPVIVITAHSDLESAVSAYQGGAFEYLPKPFDVDDAVELARRACAHAQRERAAQPPAANEPATRPAEIIGESSAMQEVFRAIGRLSRSNITVLINGESGTGKELVARALHRHSPRADKPFIALNMAAIPRDLLESELFGHERGAFTGAQHARQGRFEQANGGTLFLDEIGDMPAELQTRLLRVLADGEFYRVGGHTAVKVDVRIIAATHQNLETRVASGQFREDLFHRLNVIRMHLPSLRERRDDIPRLAAHFLARAAQELNVDPKILLSTAADYIKQLDWPGNVRQLENVCRWLTVMAASQEVRIEDLPPELRQRDERGGAAGDAGWENALQHWAEQRLIAGDDGLLEWAIPRFERIMIECALRSTGGKRQEAAKRLGWGRNTLTRKIQELGMEDSV